MSDVPAPVSLTEVRVLEGPNLYFPRPACKLSLEVPGYLEADAPVLQAISKAVGPRAGDPKQPGSQARMLYVSRLLERILRTIARAAGTARLGIRVRTGSAPNGVVVAFALSHRGRADVAARAYENALQRLLEGADLESVISEAAAALVAAPLGQTLRPLRPKIPVVAITGTNGKTTTTRLLAHMAMTAGLRTGWSSTDGVLIQGEVVETGDYSGPAGARTVLADKDVRFGVLETARGGMLLKGLGVAAVDVSVVTNVSADHLGLQGIDTVDQLAEVKAIITRATKPQGWCVLNGEDPRVWAMHSGAPGRPWCFAIDPNAPALREALGAHGRGITVMDGNIVVLRPVEEPEVLVPVLDVPLTLSGLSEHNIANALAAAAAGLAAGLPREAVIEGLRTFAPDPLHNPGRMNVYTVPLDPPADADDAGWTPGGRATVILDLAHNEGGLEALLRVAKGLRAPGARLHLGLGTGGDRTDEILHNLGEMAGLEADQVEIVHKEHYLRGRSMDDLEAHLCEGLAAVGVAPVASSPSEMEGLLSLLSHANDGDVIAEMVHADRAELHDWLMEHGATMDDAVAIRRKVVAARGEHEAEARINELWTMQEPSALLTAAHELALEYPGDARVTFELAGAYDFAGEEDTAIGLYRDALAAGLREPHRRRCVIQLASSLRVIGEAQEALTLLDELAASGLDSVGVQAFRALALHDLGKDTEAVRGLLGSALAYSVDPDVALYRRALTQYADQV